MALTKMQVEDKLDALFANVLSNIDSGVADKALPLLDKISALPGGAALDPFADIKAKIGQAIDNASDPDIAKAIADAINDAHIDGVTALKTNDGGVEITLAKSVTVSTGSGDIDVGSTIGEVLTLGGTASASLTATLNATAQFSSDGDFTLKDTGTPELSVGVDANLSLKADAHLGIADIAVVDHDPTKPEFSATFTYDLAYDGATFSATPSLSGNVGLDLDFETSNVLFGILPDIKGELKASFGTNPDGSFSQPTIDLSNLKLELGSYLGEVGKTLGQVGKLYNFGPIGTIVDIATEPFPVLNDLAQGLPFLLDQFDKVGSITGGGDGVITLGDLAAYAQPQLQPIISKFYIAAQIIKELAPFGQAAGNNGEIDFGGGSLLGGAFGGSITPNMDINSIIDQLGDKVAALQDVSQFAKNLLSEINIDTGGGGPLGGGETANSSGFSFTLFQHPERLLDIFFGDHPVTLIQYTVPPLAFAAQAGGFFPIIGPLGIDLRGSLNTGLELVVGYDTKGIETHNFFDGVYITTPLDHPGDATGPTRINPKTGMPFARYDSETNQLQVSEPVGYLDVKISAAAAVDFVIGEAGVGASFGFDVDAYFNTGDGYYRPTLDSFGCIFDIKGRAYVDVHLFFEIGFGPFSVEKNVTLAEATLADFEQFQCVSPNVVATPTIPGLATADGADLLLNVGDRAQYRLIKDNETDMGVQVVTADNPDTPQDERLNEAYVIALARDQGSDGINPANNPPPTLVGGHLDVTAFGFTQRVDDPTIIKANFGDGVDTLVIQNDVAIDSDISGGAGDDTLGGGAGRDHLRGDAGRDSLFGGLGDDHLEGGADADTLDGGKGRDILDGGTGIDSVDYSKSNRDVGVGIFVDLANPNHAGYGGDATGDVLISIENVTGTDFDDYITAQGVSYNTVLEGGKGKDTLVGGSGNDLLFGDADADKLIGNGGEDGTSYIFSWGAVNIDMQRAVQFGGDAQGDVLISIEDVQGSINNDTIRGNASNNVIDGSNGDDVLDGRGGQDKVFGGFGNDLIYGGRDGDTLDGGPGRNTLSYANTFAVTVDLGHTQDTAGNFIANAAPDNIVMSSANPYGLGRGYSTFTTLIGSAFADSLTGDIAGNLIRGGDGSDFINGDYGDDILIGGNGADTIVGGQGTDWVYYNDSSVGVTVNLTGTGQGGTAQGDTFFAPGSTTDTVENILGSFYADTLTGNALNNLIDPNISGVAGRTETVDGAAGSGDILAVNYSTWYADVGSGVSGGFTSATGGQMTRTTNGGGQLDTVNFNNTERLFFVGTYKADTIHGGDSAAGDRLYTGSGDDTIFAGLGADDVQAGYGVDTVSYGFDEFGGGQGGGTTFALDGGRGIDTLSINLALATYDIRISGTDGTHEVFGTNLSASNGGSAKNFEILGNVTTGSGNDTVSQPGAFDNVISTGDGNDIIAPGLGTDTVNGGPDTQGLTYNGSGTYNVSNSQAFYSSPGDRLVLDYSTIPAGQHVESSVSQSATIYVYDNQHQTAGFLYTNNGTYSSLTGDGTTTNQVTFSNIEGVTVTGSAGDDTLVGTDIAFTGRYGVADSRGGDDLLIGGQGNDHLNGRTGDDFLFGGDGNDVLQGTDTRVIVQSGTYLSGDPMEIDTLTGGKDADTFVLGDAIGTFYGITPFYNGQIFDSGTTTSYAIITDFKPTDGDTLQLHGGPEIGYSAYSDGTNTYILEHANPYDSGSFNANKVVAELLHFTGLDLNADYVDYVTVANPIQPFAMAAPNFAAQDAPSDETGSAGPLALRAAFAPAALMAAFAVTQTNTADDLKSAFEGTNPVAGSSVTLDGSAEAFGTFSNDPFGLGSGIILSTGRAVDLPGENTVDHPSSIAGKIPITFTKVGNTDGTTLYVADLSNLGIDIHSLQLTDSNSRVGGSGGTFSGFDIDAIALSHTLLPKVTTGTISQDDLNSDTFLPKLNVFDFSNAGVTLNQGTERPGGVDAELDGTSNGLITSLPTLGTFDSTGSTLQVGSSVTLGDGGSIGFDLTSPVSTSQPLYLYLAEAGISSGETLQGFFSASDNSIEPAGDLSTDLGAAGPDGDTTAFTYTFTPGAGDNTFSFDAVLFSEELPEFDGSDLTDLFSIKINGVEVGALSNGASLSIRSLVSSGSGDLIGNPVGTGPLADQIKADAYTRTLTITGPITPGEVNTLEITVADGRDAFLDSGILIKSGTFHTSYQDGFVGGLAADANSPPVFAAPASEILVPENTKAVTSAAATDPDSGQTLTYSIFGGEDAAKFTINPTTGALSFVAAPDFEHPTDGDGDNVYDVIVKAQDNAATPLFALQDYHARVTDVVEGQHTLTFRVAEDFYLDHAQFIVLVDGQQVGGAQTVTAPHNVGQYQTVTLQESFDDSINTVVVQFINDAFAGDPTHDRNLYVDNLILDGKLYQGEEATNTAGPNVGPDAILAESTGVLTFNTGPDTLTLRVAEDAYQGNAQFVVLVDGTQVGGAQTVTTLHDGVHYQDITLRGDFGDTPHDVVVKFINDAYDGDLAHDRNLYVDSMTLNGRVYEGENAINTAGPNRPTEAILATSTGDLTFNTLPDSLTLRVSEDFYLDHAQFVVTVDGQRVGGVQTVTASHGANQHQDITIAGDFGADPHSIFVKFTNDAFGGDRDHDRNLYVDSLTLNGRVYEGENASNTAGPNTSKDAILANSTGGLTFDVAADTFTFRVSEDAYDGHAQFVVKVDGRQLGGVQTVTASHAAHDYQDITLQGDFGPSPSQISLQFINDAFGGDKDHDRNLYVDSLTLNGHVLQAEHATNTAGPNTATEAVLAVSTGTLTFDGHLLV